VCESVARDAPARILANTADTHFAAEFDMCGSGDHSRLTTQASEKSWVAMSRNSGQHAA
jgi:predicted peptidase